MKNMLLICSLLISYHIMLGQAPTWSVKENNYQYTMTFVAKLNVDGKQLINPEDRVAAFVGNTCRGVSGVTYVTSDKNYYAYLTVFANEQAENISFKLYDSAANKIATVSKQITFVVNEHKGNLFQSYSIAEPALNNVSTILSFNFLDIKSISSTITNGQVKINVFESYALTDLKPVFALSTGATLLKNRLIQKSGETLGDFSNLVNYQVLSEDESTLTSYDVNVSTIKNPTLFYKKDAVCYAPGALKVVSKKEGIPVSLTSDGKTIVTKLISDGEVIFPNLNAGSYVVTIENEFKIINILLIEK
ncbi:hypothetical protein RCH18_001445 [Flavobacterium sp. PL11]|uniref:hypothetical protein n=1 Tax=Flavobacterium sp. PL11 TaxID=3071717 RepID=UPI002E0B5F00|nr:hypothetical protein [Flavobacterium sp. PL11]